MNRRCDCERGGDCNKVSLCALTNAEEEATEEIERLRAALERIAKGGEVNDWVSEVNRWAARIAREALQEGE